MPKTVEFTTIEKAKANLKPFKNKFQKDLGLINEIFHEQLNSSEVKINQVSNWIKKSPGKQLRPILALLSAEAFGTINEEVYTYAAAIEMIHNASLIHDDVLDDSAYRRGNSTPHQLWGVKNALLLGDFLFSCGYRLVLKTSDKECQDDLPRVASIMCESELLQSDSQFCNTPTLERYYQIIDGKTAYLFGISASAGCRLAGGSKIQKDLMQQCGNLVGRAFQIMDDWLDFSKFGEIDNKPRGADISSGIYTLPTILLLNHCNTSEKESLEIKLNSGNPNGLSDPLIDELNLKYNISNKVYQIANGFLDQAEKLLMQANPKGNLENIKGFLQSISTS
jgi:octaprenyl-diphosphate synthase